MKMKIKVLVIAIISAIILLCSQVFAETITNDKGTVDYYENGNVRSITTTSGYVSYNEDGTIDYIEGSPSISLDDAKQMLLEAPKTSSSISIDANKTSTSTNQTTGSSTLTNKTTVSGTSTSQTTGNSTSTNTKLPNTGIDNFYIMIIPIIIAITGILGFNIIRYKRMF